VTQHNNCFFLLEEKGDRFRNIQRNHQDLHQFDPLV
jgi:hypothetical protein